MKTLNFDASKAMILKNLSDGIDYSPKGSIDAPISDLVHAINALSDFCTTSSCSGRISCYMQLAERKGIHWILVRHQTIDAQSIQDCMIDAELDSKSPNTLTMLKCEGGLLHVLCRDLESARELHATAMACGFRESGLSVTTKKIVLGIRTTAFGLELPIAVGNRPIIDRSALDLVVHEANKRLLANFARIDRFLIAVKNRYGWPSFRSLKLDDSNVAANRAVSRWGHAAVSGVEGEMCVLGGFGLQSSDDPAKAGRKTDSHIVCIQNYCDSYVLKVVNSTSLSTIDLMHSSAVIDDSNTVVIFGGRKSPLMASNNLMFFDLKTLEPLSNHLVDPTCDFPLPRWGHSMIHVGNSCYLMTGGRDAQQIYSDIFVLQKESIKDGIVYWKWHKALIVNNRQMLLPFACFFHASCALDTDLAGFNHRLFPAGTSSKSLNPVMAFSRVLLHGGLLSLHDPTAVGTKFAIVETHLILENCKYIFSVTISDVEIVNSSKFISAESVSDDELALLTLKKASAHGEIGCYGHTITNIGAKTIIMVGGSSSNVDSYDATILEASECISTAAAPSRSSVDEIVTFDWLATDEGVVVLMKRDPNWSENDVHDEAPLCSCTAGCRCHHQTVVVTRDNRTILLVSGGGALAVGFLPHFCNPLAFEIAWNSEHRQFNKDDEPFQSTSDALLFQGKGSTAYRNAVDFCKEELSKSVPVVNTTRVLLAPKLAVKNIKNILEKYSLINKNYRISTFSSDISTDNSAVHIICVAEKDGIAYDAIFSSRDRFYWEMIRESMAIPVTSEFFDNCQKGVESKYLLQQGEIYSVLKRYLPAEYSSQLLFSLVNSPPSKLDIVSSQRKANDLLTSLSVQYCIDASEIPKKYELVGDVLMIPTDSLISERWFCGNSSHFWEELSACFGVKRVARKAFVDPGPKRESHVKLLHVSPEYIKKVSKKHQLTRQEQSEGWVTLIENGITFGFDITKVMFCSGNNTERVRMGTVPAAGQVIVDLYCGVGYYTLPFLVHAKAAIVHAFEWNVNSIAALVVNLSTASVEADRCVIHFGDNVGAVFGKNDLGEQLSTSSPLDILDNFSRYEIRDVARESRIESLMWVDRLTSIADRVCLGLLPSSSDGWPSAVKVIKPTGGVIHVHYNVNVSEINDWVAKMTERFRTLFSEAGKPMDIQVAHVEKVKSYAPRVHHIVVDILCTPLTTG